MPHTYDPETLERVCFRSIGKNMDSCWCLDYNKNFHGKGDYMYLLGPFSTLPGSLLTKLIQYLKNNSMLKIGHLQLLIDCSLQDLDLSRLSNNMSGLLTTVTNRCVNLRHLNLSGNTKLPLQGQVALFSTACQLETINLSDTNTSDRVMSVIGAYCTQLSELDVRHSAVTDIGLAALSTSAPSSNAGCAGASLVSLSVDGCDVSPDSAYNVLKNMPNLAHFDHPESISGAERLLLECPERAPLRLAELHGSAAAGLDVAVQGCPAAALLQLDLEQGGAVTAARELRRLERLVLSAPGRPCAGLSELIGARGAALTELTLTGARGVSAALVLRACPGLRRLDFLMCGFVAESAAGPPPAALEQFWLMQEPELAPPEETLPRVLSAPRLSHLYLHHCGAISDLAVEAALEAGTLRQLRKLSVEHCDALGPEAVLALVLQCPRLEKVTTRWCRDIALRDAEEARRLARDNGWRLDVEWK